MLDSNISPTYPHNMVNFGPLAAEVGSVVWDTQANFNRFRVLALLLHDIRAVGASQTAALNRGRHLYLAGRPSRWALAHISSFLLFIGARTIPRRTVNWRTFHRRTSSAEPTPVGRVSVLGNALWGSDATAAKSGINVRETPILGCESGFILVCS